MQSPLTAALLVRRVEERLLDLFREGKLFGTVHTCIGQEMAGVAVTRALRPGDTLVSNHRGHGHYLAWTGDVEGLIAEVMGRATGVCGGRGGSQHLCRDGFYSNGILGGMMPVAAGLAMAASQAGAGAMTVAFIGDGALGEGVVYETLNMAAKWALPLLVVIENNRYAQSTAQSQTLAGGIAPRLHAFGIETFEGDTWQWAALLETAAAAVAHVRTRGTPAALVIETYRLAPHSKGDDHRDPGEIAAHAARDPVNVWLAGRDADAIRALSEIDARLDRAVAAADAAPHAAPVDVAAPRTPPREVVYAPVMFDDERVAASIRRGLQTALASDPRVMLMGEDIESPYGGAFKVTQGLSDQFPGRVRNTPISEAALVGVANGLALRGVRPVVEIMFGDFVLLGADQWINHAAKFAWMYNDRASAPILVRTPMGGRRGYGPTHSQCLEKHLLGVPGTRVVAVNKYFAPADLYATLFATLDRPTLVIEDKVQYGEMASSVVPHGLRVEQAQTGGDAPPTLRVAWPGATSDVTIVAYGAMAAVAVDAAGVLFEEHDRVAEIIVPQQVYPLAIAPVLDSVARTGRLVTVEEGQGFMGFGSEVVALVGEAGRGARVRRVVPASHPVPTSRPFEAGALPGVDDVVQAALELCR